MPLYKLIRQTDNADKMTLNPTTQAGSDGSEYSDLSVKQDALFADLERNQEPVSYLSGWPYNGQAAGPPRISSLEVGPINPQVCYTAFVHLPSMRGPIRDLVYWGCRGCALEKNFDRRKIYSTLMSLCLMKFINSRTIALQFPLLTVFSL